MFDVFQFLSKSAASSISKLIPEKENLGWQIHMPEICLSTSLALYLSPIIKIEKRACLLFSIARDTFILTQLFSLMNTVFLSSSTVTHF